MPWPVTIDLPTPAATESLGATLGRTLSAGDVVALQGPLGAGKSTFARGLIRALTSPEEEVPSPTFTLVQTYDTDGVTISHFDLYRLKSADEAEEIGLWEALEGGAALIEWPERLGDVLPADRLTVEMAFSAVGRRATLTGYGSWSTRDVPLP